uniref:F-actin-capping protein subunit alpha n=1 Tax=Blastobotrys adeninivorans TaxID=409370 RepID=A0A060T942_BLAAD
MSTSETLAKFIADAPPGEVKEVRADIEALVEGNVQLVKGLDDPMAKYVGDKCTVVRLPDGQTSVVSPLNRLDATTFYANGKAYKYENGRVSEADSSVSVPSAGDHGALKQGVARYVEDHYPSNSGVDVFPQESGGVGIVIVDTKFSPKNFWNGQWTSQYVVKNGKLEGDISIDVHYYEDGNVRLKCDKHVSESVGESAQNICKTIADLEQAYQLEVNKTFIGLNAGPFKSLRRQLPVNRSKMDWDKFGNYRLGKTIGGE